MGRKSFFDEMIEGAQPVSLARIKLELAKGSDSTLQRQHDNVKILLKLAYRLDLKSVPAELRPEVEKHISTIKALALAYDGRIKKGHGKRSKDWVHLVNWLSEKYDEMRSSGKALFEVMYPGGSRIYDICFGTT